MALYDRVKFATSTTGTGTITVGAALSGYRTPAQASIPNAGTFTYVIEDGTAWEIGTGTYATSGTTVARSLIASSTGSLLNLSGAAIMYIDAVASILAAIQEPGQIKFPATQNPSTDANTLDDYEEGTWTPTLTFGGGSTGITYSATRSGRYTKIGRLVNVQAEVVLTNKGSSTGLAALTGLPFASASGQPNIGTLLLSNTSGMITPTASVGAASSSIIFFDFESNAFSQIDHSAFTNTTNIYVNLNYYAA